MFLTTHKPTNKHTYQNQLQNNDFANCKLLPGKRAMKICVDSFFQAEISIPPEYKVGVHCYWDQFRFVLWVREREVSDFRLP